MNIKNLFKDLFGYEEETSYEFILPDNTNNLPEEKPEDKKVFPALSVNIDYLKVKYNLLINSDIKIRKFILPIHEKKIPAALLFIDGMVNEDAITNSVLQPLLLKNSMRMQDETKPGRISVVHARKSKFNLESFLFNELIPHNSVSKEKKFSNIIEKVNSGFCCLFVDGLDVAFCIETKGIKGRTVAEPINESIIRGSQEAFVESIRTNTSMLRKIINNENLIIEEVNVGKISKTKVAICYMKNIANDDLVAEAKFRVSNLKIDYLLSCGQLEQFIKDNPDESFPQTIATERPDRTCNYLLNGRIAIIVNGTPYALIIPAMFIDFLSST